MARKSTTNHTPPAPPVEDWDAPVVTLEPVAAADGLVRVRCIVSTRPWAGRTPLEHEQVIDLDEETVTVLEEKGFVERA